MGDYTKVNQEIANNYRRENEGKQAQSIVDSRVSYAIYKRNEHERNVRQNQYICDRKGAAYRAELDGKGFEERQQRSRGRSRRRQR